MASNLMPFCLSAIDVQEVGCLLLLRIPRLHRLPEDCPVIKPSEEGIPAGPVAGRRTKDSKMRSWGC